MSRRFTLYILFGMILGVIVGYILNVNLDAESAKAAAGYFAILTDIFLRLIKMIIAPLVFSTLVVGIVHVGDTASLSRIGFLTVAWFLGASVISLLLGAVMVEWMEPGAGLGLPLPEKGAALAVKGSALSFKDFITHVFPKSFFEAMASNEILQIVVFSLFTGVALAALHEAGKKLTEILEHVVHVMLLITGYVMKFAPVAVFAAIAATITTQGLGIIGTYVKFVGGFYFALILLWGILLAAGFLVIGRKVVDLAHHVREPMLLAFSTASSEAAYPKTLERLEAFGIPKRIASFVLPLGYSFNLDGSMMYCTFATIFIAQAYGIDLSLGQIATLLTLLMLTSKGMAGVPRASLVVIAAALPLFNIPEEGVLIILAVDQFLDMGRTATNVLGNAVATSVVAKLNDK